MDAKCDDWGGGRLYYQGRSDEEWRVQYLSYYPHTDIEKLFDTHIYELASKLTLTKEEEAAAADPNNDQWEDMPEEEEKELIEAGDVALQKYKTYKKEKKKKSTRMSSGINKNNKEKTTKTAPEKKKKEKADLIARFKISNRTYMSPKSFLKWSQEKENQDKPDLVKFFNYKKKINEFKRLLIEDGKNPKWEVDEEPGDNLKEGVDYI